MIAASLPALVLLLAAGADLPAARNRTEQVRFCDAKPEELPVLVRAVSSAGPVSERILAASERFLGVRYVRDPLGEGPGSPPDADPLLRYDAVDCTTFVETVIALARKADGELQTTLNDLRYDGPVSYANRNHFFVAHWLRANVRKGYVRDATHDLAGEAAVAHTKVVTEQQWHARERVGRIKLPPERAPIGSFPLSYVPIDQLAQLAPRIPSGTLFAVVREDRPELPFMVTHLGFFVQTPRGTVVRHAGRDLYLQVVDEQFEHFLARNRRYRKWRVLGFQLLEVLDAPPREPASAGL
jgi:hypothetical protein